ncbi:MAG: hypothetical protein ABW073_08775 [Acidimicrobiia bacterium]
MGPRAVEARSGVPHLEAAAAALLLEATVWLSEPAGGGLLPSVLDAEGVAWRIVAVA